MARTDPPVAHDRTDVLGQVVRGPQRQVRWHNIHTVHRVSIQQVPQWCMAWPESTTIVLTHSYSMSKLSYIIHIAVFLSEIPVLLFHELMEAPHCCCAHFPMKLQCLCTHLNLCTHVNTVYVFLYTPTYIRTYVHTYVCTWWQQVPTSPFPLSLTFTTFPYSASPTVCHHILHSRCVCTYVCTQSCILC